MGFDVDVGVVGDVEDDLVDLAAGPLELGVYSELTASPPS
jgi:hypothetical protein